MVKIKICGITNAADALYISNTNIWAMGFIFVENTPRYINFDKAAEIIKLLPHSIEKVGVFVNSEIDYIEQAVKICKINKIQLHGNESPSFCEIVAQKTGIEVIKAFRIKNKNDLTVIDSYKNSVKTILLDSYSKDDYGGTGESFNWDLVNSLAGKSFNIILAGGINHNNIFEAITIVKPFAVDLSSGVEEYKGKKDHKKIDLLFQNAYKI